MTDTQVNNTINDFRSNTPICYRYPSFNDYKLTDNDIEIIRNKINLYGNYDLNDISTKVIMRKFLGDLIRDRVNEDPNRIGPPVLSWD